MSDVYENLTLQKQREELLARQEDAKTVDRNTMDFNFYKEITGDAGAHDQMLGELDRQLSILGEIRQTGRPAVLTPAQQESRRYENIGHFDKKERKKAAKEAAALTKKARHVQEKLQKKPEGASSLPYDIEMTKYMEEAELESLKANGFKKDSLPYLRTRLKYLHHIEIVLTNAAQTSILTDAQIMAVTEAYVSTQKKIQALLQVQDIREQYRSGYREEIDRQLELPDLPEAEAEKVMKQSLSLLKRNDIDLISAEVFPVQMVRVNEQQAHEYLENHVLNQQEVQEQPHVQEQEAERKTLEIFTVQNAGSLEIETNENTQLIDELLREILNYKERLGGSVLFGDKMPSYDTEKKTILGYPREAFEAFCRDHIKQAGNFFTRGFFKVLASIGGIRPEGLESTPYETACLQLQSLKALAQRKTALERIFREADEHKEEAGVAGACNLLFADISRIVCHSDQNTPRGVLAAMNQHFEMLRHQLPLARAENRMEEFFSAMHGVCFEDRTRNLMEYCSGHTGDTSTLEEIPDDGHLYVRDVGRIPDVNSDMNYAEAAAAWVQALYDSYANELNFDEVGLEGCIPCLIREMVGQKFKDFDEEGGTTEETVTVTEEMLRSEKMRSYFYDILMLWGD